MIKITNDLFGIDMRLKRICPKYQVYFNNRHNRFEVHADGKLQFVVGFEKLDYRTIEQAYRTRVQNIDALTREIDKKNEENSKKIYKDIEKRKADLAEMLAYADRAGHEVVFKKEQKIGEF